VPIGPKAAISLQLRLVTGASIAIDSSDPTGKRAVFIGTTGVGVWTPQLTTPKLCPRTA
jgi:hypothetical protein